MISAAEHELQLPTLIVLIEQFYQAGTLDELEIRNQLEVMSLETLRSFQTYVSDPVLKELSSSMLAAREAKLTELVTPTVKF